MKQFKMTFIQYKRLTVQTCEWIELTEVINASDKRNAELLFYDRNNELRRFTYLKSIEEIKE